MICCTEPGLTKACENLIYICVYVCVWVQLHVQRLWLWSNNMTRPTSPSGEGHQDKRNKKVRPKHWIWSWAPARLGTKTNCNVTHSLTHQKRAVMLARSRGWSQTVGALLREEGEVLLCGCPHILNYPKRFTDFLFCLCIIIMHTEK
jgi:hypothetical protein